MVFQIGVENGKYADLCQACFLVTAEKMQKPIFEPVEVTKEQWMEWAMREQTLDNLYLHWCKENACAPTNDAKIIFIEGMWEGMRACSFVLEYCGKVACRNFIDKRQTEMQAFRTELETVKIIQE